MYQLGLVSISFRRHTPEQILAAAKLAGLSCIEWGSDVHAPWDQPERLEEIARLQKEEEISCSSYGTYFRLGKDDVTTLSGYFQAAKCLGTRILRLWCGTKGSEEYTDCQLQELYDQCRQAAALAEEDGMILAMECHNGTLTDRKEAALALMEAVGSPAFRMYWQPNQWRSQQENLAYARLLAPYTTHIHVFNWDCPEGQLVKYPLEESVALWQQYLAQIPGQRALLLEFMPDDRLETLQTEADALRKIAGADL